MNATFEQKIQAWVSIDNQLKLLNEKVQELRDKRNDLSENITKYAQTNNLQNATIQISDGKLKFTNTRVTAPLTFKYLEKSLGEVIKNESQVKQIVEYVKEHRDSKIVPEIKRLSNK
jgi:uncharacterized coiled-coil DUF342 family protein